MEEKKEAAEGKAGSPFEEEKAEGDTLLSETWAQDAQAALEDFIEQQGIYIRQQAALPEDGEPSGFPIFWEGWGNTAQHMRKLILLCKMQETCVCVYFSF